MPRLPPISTPTSIFASTNDRPSAPARVGLWQPQEGPHHASSPPLHPRQPNALPTTDLLPSLASAMPCARSTSIPVTHTHVRSSFHAVALGATTTFHPAANVHIPSSLSSPAIPPPSPFWPRPLAEPYLHPLRCIDSTVPSPLPSLSRFPVTFASAPSFFFTLPLVIPPNVSMMASLQHPFTSMNGRTSSGPYSLK